MSEETLTDKQRYLMLTKQYARDIDARDNLLRLIYDDLKMRSDDGVVDISNFIWERLEKVVITGEIQ